MEGWRRWLRQQSGAGVQHAVHDIMHALSETRALGAILRVQLASSEVCTDLP